MPIVPIVIIAVFLIACFMVGIVVLKFVGKDQSIQPKAQREQTRAFNLNNLD